MLKAVEERDENGFVEQFYVDEEDVRQGDYISFYPEGNVCMKCSFQDGLIEGVCEVYHKNQALYTRYTCHENRFDGLYEQFYEDGKPAIRCFYKKGVLDGICEIYDGDGCVSEWYVYKDGQKLEGKAVGEYLTQLNKKALLAQDRANEGR